MKIEKLNDKSGDISQNPAGFNQRVWSIYIMGVVFSPLQKEIITQHVMIEDGMPGRGTEQLLL
jgi:hypothetical protein